ncbi:helix-turn-helix domain-containing protein [Methanosarcina sp. WWM596]|uniref:helix-turn-helix domain-containing protein n=1 Tax=Methanosarcina sp. WWM596 TaxID=1434103 RepID=UPI0012E031BF
MHCRVPRVKCGDCGVLQIKVPWAREQSGFTLRMEAMILELAKKMSVLQVGKLPGENDKKLWRVVQHYVGKARSKEDFSDIFVVGIDETSCRSGNCAVQEVLSYEGADDKGRVTVRASDRTC